MKYKFKISTLSHAINVFLPLLILILFGVLFLALPKKRVSEIEKRVLTPLPPWSWQSLFDGKFTRNYEEFFADNFPYRDGWISIAGNIRSYYGYQPKGEARIVATVVPEFQPDEQLVHDSSENAMKDSAEKPSHSLFIYEGKAYQIFGGNARVAGIYSSRINALHKALGDSVRFYNMVVPSSSAFYLPDKYSKSKALEKSNIEMIYQGLNSSICSADAYGELLKHKDEYLYFGTDHHWTALGAYYAYRAFSACADFNPLELNSLEKRTKKNFLGTLYALARVDELKENPDYLDYYLIPGNYSVVVNTGSDENKWSKGKLLSESASGSASYGVFLGSDYPVMKISSENNNGRKLMVLKESYGNAFVPFLAPHFQTIYVADIRYFQFALLDFIQKNQVGEILVINGIFMANNPYFPNKIKSMIYKAQTPYVLKKKDSTDAK